MNEEIVGILGRRNDAGMLAALIAALVQNNGGRIEVTKFDIDAVEGRQVVCSYDPAKDAVIVTLQPKAGLQVL